MELRHLRYYVAVVEGGSLTEAAEQKLHTSQPSLSRQIQNFFSHDRPSSSRTRGRIESRWQRFAKSAVKTGRLLEILRASPALWARYVPVLNRTRIAMRTNSAATLMRGGSSIVTITVKTARSLAIHDCVPP
jgi:hypothetical protein